ncbi:MAG TPA: ABC transporter permease [Isosphaeraceae bacterium]|nr:ABC transporter permease [Isosphaeraceae bacterium]
MNPRPLYALIRKDLQVFLSDRRAVILSFVVPIALASIFASLNPGGGGGSGNAKIPVLIVDQDHSPLARKVIEGLRGDENVELKEATLDEARTKIQKGEAGVAVAIPAGFGAAAAKAMFRATGKPELTFLVDPTHGAEAGMARGILTEHVMKAVSQDAFSGPGGLAALEEAEASLDKEAGMPPGLKLALRTMFEDVKRVRHETDAPELRLEKGDPGSKASFGFDLPFQVHEEKVSAAGQVDRGIVAAHAFAGMGVQFLLFASIEGGVGLLAERQRGLWKRLRAAPLTRFELLGAKVASQSLIGLLVLFVVFAFGMAFFHVRFSGSIVGFALVSLAFSVSAATFGLLIAALGKTPQAARGVAIMAVLLMVLLGGAWIPSQFFPAWVQSLTVAIPTRWAVDGLEGATWRGLGLDALLVKAAALMGFAFVFGVLAVMWFRWEER